MQQRTDAIREIMEARRMAESSVEANVQDQWLHLAALLDEYVRACDELENTRRLCH